MDKGNVTGIFVCISPSNHRQRAIQGKLWTCYKTAENMQPPKTKPKKREQKYQQLLNVCQPDVSNFYKLLMINPFQSGKNERDPNIPTSASAAVWMSQPSNPVPILSRYYSNHHVPIRWLAYQSPGNTSGGDVPRLLQIPTVFGIQHPPVNPAGPRRMTFLELGRIENSREGLKKIKRNGECFLFVGYLLSSPTWTLLVCVIYVDPVEDFPLKDRPVLASPNLL